MHYSILIILMYLWNNILSKTWYFKYISDRAHQNLILNPIFPPSIPPFPPDTSDDPFKQTEPWSLQMLGVSYLIFMPPLSPGNLGYSFPPLQVPEFDVDVE